nr:hypothetical protein [Veronia pacifica]
MPVQYFFNRRLKVFYEAPSGAMEEQEPFSFDNLSRYQMRDSLMHHLMENGDSEASLEAFYARQRAAGDLPLSFFGELTLDEEQEAVTSQYHAIVPFLTDPRPALEVNLSIPTSRGTLHLQGWLGQCYRDGRILHRSGKIRGQDRLASWIEHLCLCAGGLSIHTRFFGIGEELVYAPVEQQEAYQSLQIYLEAYYDGQQKPLLYLPSTIFAGLSSCMDKKGNFHDEEGGREKAFIKMQQAYVGGYLTIGEGQNEYVARVWPELTVDALSDLFSYGKTILLPALLASTAAEADQ